MPVVVEKLYDAPVQQIWKALTDGNEMRKWYFDIADFKPVVGHEFQFLAGDDKQKWLHLCKVTAVEKEKLIAYDWRYDGYAGNSNVTFELIPRDGKTLLRVTHRGLGTLPQDRKEFSRGSFEAGWTSILGEGLPAYLEKNFVV